MVHEEKPNNIVLEIAKAFGYLSFGAKFIILTPIVFMLVLMITVEMGKNLDESYLQYASARTTMNTPSVVRLSPNSQYLRTGSSFSIFIQLDTNGNNVNAAAITLQYPSSNLEVTQVTINDQIFDVKVNNSFGNGKINIVVGSTTPKSGVLNVATIVFKGIARGDARISFASPTSVLSADTNLNVLGAMRGGKYSIR